MKICDRCKKTVGLLAPFGVARKTWSDGIPISGTEYEVCTDCFPEGKEIIDTLARELDRAQRTILIDATEAWLASPVQLAAPQQTWAQNVVANDAGKSFIERFKARFLAMFKKEEASE